MLGSKGLSFGNIKEFILNTKIKIITTMITILGNDLGRNLRVSSVEILSSVF